MTPKGEAYSRSLATENERAEKAEEFEENINDTDANAATLTGSKSVNEVCDPEATEIVTQMVEQIIAETEREVGLEVHK